MHTTGDLLLCIGAFLIGVKLGIDFYLYRRDRLSNTNAISSLIGLVVVYGAHMAVHADLAGFYALRRLVIAMVIGVILGWGGPFIFGGNPADNTKED